MQHSDTEGREAPPSTFRRIVLPTIILVILGVVGGIAWAIWRG
jgi:hypothetical protein